MNLRQRVAWLLLSVFLGSTFAFMYYLLDMADQYMLFSVQHSKLHQDEGNDNVPQLIVQDSVLHLNPRDIQHPQSDRLKLSDQTYTKGSSSFWHHIVDIPVPVLIIILLIAYFQIFASIFYFTLPHIPSFRDVNIWTIPFLGWFYIAHRMRTLLCCVNSNSRRDRELYRVEGKEIYIK